MATRRRKYEFKPDRQGTNFFKKLYMTRLQRLQLLQWTLYALLCIALLIVQDVMLSRIRFFGATTDLVAGIILLIGIYEGLERGGMFVLVASTVYWFSGSAPGSYVIMLLTFLTVGATYFRQSFWRRGFASMTLCTGIALMVYELCLFAIGLFNEQTIPVRFGVFMLTGFATWVAMAALYPLVNTIAKIGGDTWKE